VREVRVDAEALEERAVEVTDEVPAIDLTRRGVDVVLLAALLAARAALEGGAFELPGGERAQGAGVGPHVDDADLIDRGGQELLVDAAGEVGGLVAAFAGEEEHDGQAGLVGAEADLLAQHVVGGELHRPRRRHVHGRALGLHRPGERSPVRVAGRRLLRRRIARHTAGERDDEQRGEPHVAAHCKRRAGATGSTSSRLARSFVGEGLQVLQRYSIRR